MLDNVTPPLMYRGSVKDILGPMTIGQTEAVLFDYSNRYSVFDWGEMPDHLAFKGESLAQIAYLFFKYLEDAKFWRENEKELRKKVALAPEFIHHQVQLELDKNLSQGVAHHLLQFLPPHSFSAKALKIIRPKFNGTYDYSEYQNAPTETLVPLEVVFRFALTEHSSLLKRSTPEYLKSLGLYKSSLNGDEKFIFPVIEFFTKLESTDRPLTYQEAKECAGLTDQEFKILLAKNALCALMISFLFKKIGVDLIDGKFEWGFAEEKSSIGRQFILADSIGPDELRLKYKDVELSKEILRIEYRKNKWFRDTELAKEMAKKGNTVDWILICKNELNSYPPKLDENFLSGVSMIYRTLVVALWPWVFNHQNNADFGEVYGLDKLANFLKSNSEVLQ